MGDSQVIQGRSLPDRVAHALHERECAIEAIERGARVAAMMLAQADEVEQLRLASWRAQALRREECPLKPDELLFPKTAPLHEFAYREGMAHHARFCSCGTDSPSPPAAQLRQFRLGAAPVPRITLGDLPIMIAMPGRRGLMAGPVRPQAPQRTPCRPRNCTLRSLNHEPLPGYRGQDLV